MLNALHSASANEPFTDLRILPWNKIKVKQYKDSQFTEFIQAQCVTKAEFLHMLYFYTDFTSQNF